MAAAVLLGLAWSSAAAASPPTYPVPTSPSEVHPASADRPVPGASRPGVLDVQTPGYWLAGADGSVYNFGPGAGTFSDAGAIPQNEPIVGMAAPDDGGYWLVAADGAVVASGDVTFHGSASNLILDQPIVGMAATPDGGGYWLVAADAASSPTATPGTTARWAASPSTGPSWAWPPHPTATATGWWRPTAASSPSATPTSGARPATSC